MKQAAQDAGHCQELHDADLAEKRNGQGPRSLLVVMQMASILVVILL